MSLNQLVSSEMVREITFNPISAIIPAFEETWDKSLFVLSAIKKMVIGLISVKNINGPITIAQVAEKQRLWLRSLLGSWRCSVSV